MLAQRILQAHTRAQKLPIADTNTTANTSLKPVTTVDELRKCFFQKTKNRKNLFLGLARNKRFIEASAKALFEHLDVDKNGHLSLKEMKGVFDVIIRRAAQLVMGFSWGIGFVVKKQSKKIFKKKILPFSSKKEGADIFNLMVLIRNSLLYCAGGNGKSAVDEISKHFYEVGSINYNIVSSKQIPVALPETDCVVSNDCIVCDDIPEAITSETSSISNQSNGDSETSSQVAACLLSSTSSEQIRAVLQELSGRRLLA